MSRIKELAIEAAEYAQQAIDGEIDELRAYAELDEVEKSIRAQKELLKQSAIDKAENNYNSKKFEHSGYLIEVASKTTWDYKHIESWDKKKKELKDIEEKAKVSATKNMNIDMETGEYYEPAHKKSTTFLKISKL